MSNMTAYEIRLKILEMAKDLAEKQYNTAREAELKNWESQVEQAKQTGTPIPNYTPTVAYPDENDVVTRATALNVFVSNMPQVVEPTSKSTKKST